MKNLHIYNKIFNILVERRNQLSHDYSNLTEDNPRYDEIETDLSARSAEVNLMLESLLEIEKFADTSESEAIDKFFSFLVHRHIHLFNEIGNVTAYTPNCEEVLNSLYGPLGEVEYISAILQGYEPVTIQLGEGTSITFV